MSKGYGVFGHVPDNADDDGLLPYEDDDSGVSWGHALRRRNPWKRGDDEDADYDDGRYAAAAGFARMPSCPSCDICTTIIRICGKK